MAELKVCESLLETIEKKVISIFNALIDGGLVFNEYGCIKKDDLVAMGISDKTLRSFEQRGILSVPKKSLGASYRLTYDTIDKLFMYGIRLLKIDSDIERANRCFEICYNTKRKADFFYQWALTKLECGSYLEAYNIIKGLDPKAHKVFAGRVARYRNCVLLLLNYFCDDIDSKDLVDVSKLKFRDIVLTGDGYDERGLERNKVKRTLAAIFQKYRFDLVPDIIGQLYDSKIEYSPRYELLMKLNELAAKKLAKIKGEVVGFVDGKSYEKIVSFYRAEEKRRQLSVNERCILLVAEEIVRVSLEKTISVPTVDGTSIERQNGRFGIKEMHQAIEGKNFKLAFDEIQVYRCQNGHSRHNDILYKLLNCLCKLIDQFSQEDIEAYSSEVDALSCGLKVSLEDLGYSDYDNDMVEAFAYLNEMISNDGSFGDYKTIGIKLKIILMMKLIYARCCYYYAKKFYDFAYEMWFVYAGDVAMTQECCKIFEVASEYVRYGDTLVSEVKKSNGLVVPLVEFSFIEDVEIYKKILFEIDDPKTRVRTSEEG